MRNLNIDLVSNTGFNNQQNKEKKYFRNALPDKLQDEI